MLVSFGLIGFILFSLLPNPYPSLEQEVLRATSEMTSGLLDASAEDTKKMIDSFQRLAEQAGN